MVVRPFVLSPWAFVVADNVICVALLPGRGDCAWPAAQTTLLGLSVPLSSLRTLKPTISSMIPNATA